MGDRVSACSTWLRVLTHLLLYAKRFLVDQGIPLPAALALRFGDLLVMLQECFHPVSGLLFVASASLLLGEDDAQWTFYQKGRVRWCPDVDLACPSYFLAERLLMWLRLLKVTTPMMRPHIRSYLP